MYGDLAEERRLVLSQLNTVVLMRRYHFNHIQMGLLNLCCSFNHARLNLSEVLLSASETKLAGHWLMPTPIQPVKSLVFTKVRLLSNYGLTSCISIPVLIFSDSGWIGQGTVPENTP